ncbi:hypothetical protein EG329_008851 [Mollisiaceae sp. DMI_Dod_QoI]|nr:hypothetical protein EG329_008851 [Helotiales sp. DMI_Dod_QoI]
MAELPHTDPEKSSHAKTTDLGSADPGEQEHTLAKAAKKKSLFTRGFIFWSFLILYSICCIAISIILVKVIDGFNAAVSTTPRYINGKLQLRVADITTLISAGLVVIKLFVTSWTLVAVWRCAYSLTHGLNVQLSKEQLSFMTKHKLPPWLNYPFELPRRSGSWVISAILLLMFPQTFIAPLLSGAVNWNPVIVPEGSSVPVNSTSSFAESSLWYQYTDSTYPDERNQVLKTAFGAVGLSWSDSSLASANGTSITGNGCRHIVNNNGLKAGSLQYNTTLPCIRFHDITWATSEDQIPASYTSTVFQKALSIVNDSTDLSHYNEPGHAVLFNPNVLWNPVETNSFPVANSFTGTMGLALVLAHTYDCKSSMGVNNFGNVANTTAYPQYIYQWALGTCYLFANVTFTAGVTSSAVSKYLSPVVIEDQTPIDKVVFQPSPWTQESFWLLPDLMTTVALANSTQIPTWYNLDIYAQSLIRQSYLGAWGSLHQTFDQATEVSFATPGEPRIQATVSYSRVFSWLAISLLTSVGGILLLGLTWGEEKPDVSDSVVAKVRKEDMNDAKKILHDLASLDFF